MNKEKATVTMSLQDYEDLKSYENAYRGLINDLKRLTYIDSMTTDEIVVVIGKQTTEDYIAPFAASDCELDGYPDGVTVIWK
jgi:hypothetical protein